MVSEGARKYLPLFFAHILAIDSRKIGARFSKCIYKVDTVKNKKGTL
jgi:hypothetical protein